MSEIGLCLVYVTCLLALYNGAIIPLIRRVEKAEKELHIAQNEVKVMRSELDVIRNELFVEELDIGDK